jgi:hypothetical protein
MVRLLYLARTEWPNYYLKAVKPFYQQPTCRVL